MATHRASESDRHRLVGALSVAAGVALLTVGVLSFGSQGGDDLGTSGPGDSTEPTVLGEVVTQPSGTEAASPDAPAAVPATFSLADDEPDATSTSRSSRSSSGPTGSTTSTTGAAVIGSPVSVTVPTTRSFPTTTAPTTTTEATTSTTEPTTTTEATTSTSTP